ncbi:MAG: hypothetical protein ACO33A_09710, partial [Hyphomonas sp.]
MTIFMIPTLTLIFGWALRQSGAGSLLVQDQLITCLSASWNTLLLSVTQVSFGNSTGIWGITMTDRWPSGFNDTTPFYLGE